MFGANGVGNNAPLADCNGNRSWEICVFMGFDKRLSGLQALQGSDFDGKVVFVFLPIRILTAVCAKHMHHKSQSCGSEQPMSKHSGVLVFFICQWPLLVLPRFVADGELLAVLILMCSVQMVLATMLH